jgi:hypothetical protein
LRVTAKLPVGRRADGTATTTAAVGTALLEGQQLLGAEGLVVSLRGGLDEVLEVGAEQEVPEIDELAVLLVLDVDNTPPVLATTDLLAVDNDVLLRADNGEGDETLLELAFWPCGSPLNVTYLDLAIQGALLIVELLIIVGEHLEVVESELLLDALLELLTLLHSQGVGLGNDRDNVDHIGQLLQDDNVDGLERVAGRLNEEEAAVDASVLDVPLSLGGELLSQVGGVLIFDVLDDRIPAAVVVDQVAIAGSVDNVEPQTDAVLLNDVGSGLDLGGGPDGLIGLHASLGVDQVRGEDGVDEGRLSETSLA